MYPLACLPICGNSVDDGVVGERGWGEGVCGVVCRVNNLQLHFPFSFFSFLSLFFFFGGESRGAGPLGSPTPVSAPAHTHTHMEPISQSLKLVRRVQ